MTDAPMGPHWWQAADGKWYPGGAIPAPSRSKSVVACDVGAILLALAGIALLGVTVSQDDSMIGQQTAWRAGALGLAAILLSACMFHVAMRLAGEARSEANSLSKGVPYQRARRMLAFGAYYIIAAGLVVLIGFYGSSRVSGPDDTDEGVRRAVRVSPAVTVDDGDDGDDTSTVSTPLDKSHETKLRDAWQELGDDGQESTCDEVAADGTAGPAEALMARIADGPEREGWTAGGVGAWLTAACDGR